MKSNFRTLYREAVRASKYKKLSKFASYGGVGSALLAKNGKIYTGACIDACCGIGFCAEHSAITDMLKEGESSIQEIIAVDGKGKILPPCGRCRELIFQINTSNKHTLVHLSSIRRKTITALLPEPWGVG